MEGDSSQVIYRGPTAFDSAQIGSSMLLRAEAMIPGLVALQGDTEKRARYSEETHQAFTDAGFYNMLVPRKFGGYELEIETFIKLVMIIARGCPSTAWQFCFGASHATTICTIFDETLQAEIFKDGHFVCATTVKPQGELRQDENGDWRLSGTYNYCSGIPYSTHFLSQAFPFYKDGSRGGPVSFLASRKDWELLDDWGDTLGLKGSGSQSIKFDNALIPARFVIEQEILNANPGARAAGLPSHGDSPIYYGRVLSYLVLEPASISVGAVKGALDEYVELMRTKLTMRPPIQPRYEDPDYRRWYGLAIGKLAAAEAAVLGMAQQWTEAARRSMTGEAPFTIAEDLRLILLGSEVVNLAWDVMQEILWRTAGSTPARDGQRMQRAFRDTAMIRAHAYNTYFDVMARELADEMIGHSKKANESFATRL